MEKAALLTIRLQTPAKWKIKAREGITEQNDGSGTTKKQEVSVTRTEAAQTLAPGIPTTAEGFDLAD